MPNKGKESSMKLQGTYKTMRDKDRKKYNFLRIPSMIEPADGYSLEVLQDGTLIYRPAV
jgi:hypothetical protein